MIENISKEISSLLENNEYQKLKDRLIKFNEVDIAELLQEIDEVEALAIFRLLPEEIAMETFSYLDIDYQESMIKAMTKSETINLVDNLYIDDMVDLLEEMPNSIVNKIMRNVDHGKRSLINEYLNYPKYSAGSIMTPEFISVREEDTIKDVLDSMRHLDEMSETFYILYIINEKYELKGFVEIKDILTNDPSTKIRDIYNDKIIYVQTHTDQEIAAKILDKYEFLALPVVDNTNKLVGVITFDDALQVIQEETEEDFSKMAAVTPTEKRYLDSSILELSKNRVIWLLILMMSSTLSQLVIQSYDHLLTVVTGLVAFMPMLTDSAGNAGSQASTTIIRGLSIGELEIRDFPKILFKEFEIALMVGLGLSVVNFARIMLFTSSGIMMAFTVSIALLMTIILAKLVGASLPIVATAVGVDPTIMAAPLLTTIVDSVTLVIYFTVASIFLL